VHISLVSSAASASASAVSVPAAAAAPLCEDRRATSSGRGGAEAEHRMGVPSDEVVQICHADAAWDPAVVTVSCPDKTGLGCDLCRTILEFGLRITRSGIPMFSLDFALWMEFGFPTLGCLPAIAKN